MSDTKSDTETSSVTSDTEDTQSHSSVPLELDRDGLELINPLSTDSEDYPDFTSEFGVTSFHEDIRYTPDPGTPEYFYEPTSGVTSHENSLYLSPDESPNNSSANSNDTVIDIETSLTMAPLTTSEKYLKAYKKNLLIWEDQFAPFQPSDILPFQVTETIRDIDKLLVESREIQSHFEQTPHEDFTDAMRDRVIALRSAAINFKKGVMRNANQQAAPTAQTASDTAKRVAQQTYGAVEPTLTGQCDNLKKESEEIRKTTVTTTSQLKKLEAEGDIMIEDLTDAIAQWEGLKKEAVTAANEGAAMLCVGKIATLTREKKELSKFVRTKCADLGCLPGTAAETAAAAAIKPPKFSGNLTDSLDYFTFAQQLEEYFEVTGSFSHAMKFIKLKTDCVTGQAAAAVKITESYDEAMDELKKLFGQPRLLFSAKASEIRKMGKCPDTPLETRTWALGISNILRHLAKLATDHNLSAMFEGANIVEAVETNMKFRDLNKFREKLKEQQTHDATFSLEDRKKRVSYLIDYFDSMVDSATFEVDFNLTRSNKACDSMVSTRKGRADKPETAKQAKSYNFRRGESSESSGGSPPPPAKPSRSTRKGRADKPGTAKQAHSYIQRHRESSTSSGGSPPPPTKPAKRNNNKSKKNQKQQSKAYTNKSSSMKIMDCKLCKMKHKEISYCHVYQRNLIKDRWKLICTTKSCPRCLRMDAAFNPETREDWYKEHKNFCTDSFLCDVDECKDRPPHLRNNFTLCSKHREQNRGVHEKFVKQLDQNMVSSEMKFFLNYDPVFPQLEDVSMIHKNFPVEADTVVEPDPMSPACYMLQTIAAPNGQPMLAFYDTGCYAAAMNERAFSLLATKTVRPGPTWLEVASGEKIKIEHGDEQFGLELYTKKPKRHVAMITALRMEEVSGKFPLWPLTEAFNEIQAA